MSWHARADERRRVALGLRPRTLGGWMFWLGYWSPPAMWWQGRGERGKRRMVEILMLAFVLGAVWLLVRVAYVDSPGGTGVINAALGFLLAVLLVAAVAYALLRWPWR